MKNRPVVSCSTAIVLLGVLSFGSLVASAAAGDRQASRGLHIVVIEGENSVNIIQQKTAVAPIVEVRDRNNNPVAGAAVTFAVKGGKAALQDGVKQLVVTTDAAGRASVAINPITKGAVEIQVNAASGGQTATATISQTNVANAADAAKASAKTSAGGGGHTGLIITSAALVAGGVVGYQKYQDYKEEDPEINEACGFHFSGNTSTVTAAGGAFTYPFEADCNWKATSDQPWLILTGPTTGARVTEGGNQTQPTTLPYTVQPNTGALRIGHITIQPQTTGLLFGSDAFSLTITQTAGQ